MEVESKTRANGLCPIDPFLFPIEYVVIDFKSSGCFTRGNVLVPSGKRPPENIKALVFLRGPR